MPIKVTKYTCKHKCGHGGISSKNDMAEHEDKHCFKNPEMKTCETCIHRIYDKESDEYSGTYHIRGCKVKEMNDYLEEIHDMLVIPRSAKQHVKPLFGCPCHNLKSDGVPFMLKDYKERVKRALTLHYRPKEIEGFPF
jgi:hypothetical protein